jgi:hypothetical protein
MLTAARKSARDSARTVGPEEQDVLPAGALALAEQEPGGVDAAIGRSAGTLSDARSAGLVAAYVRTVKTASGGTAVQVHSAHYPRTFRGALDCIRRHSGAPG